jgi:two-component system, NarL family, nitrate/nitrite response regulator NarL
LDLSSHILNEDLRCLVVADDPFVRKTLGSALRAAIPGATIDVSHTLDNVDVSVDVIVWDVGARHERVLDLLEETRVPLIPVVVLLPTQAGTREAVAWGARGVLARDVDDEGLSAAVRAVRTGVSVIDTQLLGAALRKDQPVVRTSTPGERLTAREVQVLGLVAEGLPNKLIADRLNISEHTVKFHINASMTRLGAQSRTEAVVRAVRKGLLLV